MWFLPALTLHFCCEPKFLGGGGGAEGIQTKQPLPSSSILQQGGSPLCLGPEWVQMAASFQEQRVTPVAAAGVSSYKTAVWCQVSERSDKSVCVELLSKPVCYARQSSESAYQRLRQKPVNTKIKILQILISYTCEPVSLQTCGKILRAKIVLARRNGRYFNWLHVPQGTPLLPSSFPLFKSFLRWDLEVNDSELLIPSGICPLLLSRCTFPRWPCVSRVTGPLQGRRLARRRAPADSSS